MWCERTGSELYETNPVVFQITNIMVKNSGKKQAYITRRLNVNLYIAGVTRNKILNIHLSDVLIASVF